MADVPILIQLRTEVGLDPIRGIAITYRVQDVELDLKGTMTGKGEIERRQPVYRTEAGKIYIWGDTVEEVKELGERIASGAAKRGEACGSRLSLKTSQAEPLWCVSKVKLTTCE